MSTICSSLVVTDTLVSQPGRTVTSKTSQLANGSTLPGCSPFATLSSSRRSTILKDLKTTTDQTRLSRQSTDHSDALEFDPIETSPNINQGSADALERRPFSELEPSFPMYSRRIRKPTDKAKDLTGTGVKLFSSMKSKGEDGPALRQNMAGQNLMHPGIIPFGSWVPSNHEVSPYSRTPTFSLDGAPPSPVLRAQPIVEEDITFEMEDECQLRRVSERERRPTARAIAASQEKESETRKRRLSEGSNDGAIRKKRISTNPATTKPIEHQKTTGVMNPEDHEDNLILDEPQTEVADTLLEKEEAAVRYPKSRSITVKPSPAGPFVTLKLRKKPEVSQPREMLKRRLRSAARTQMHAENSASDTKSGLKSHCVPPIPKAECSLQCLTPSSRLVALAEIASHWPSEKKAGPSLNNSPAHEADFEKLLAKAYVEFCECSSRSKALSTVPEEEFDVRNGVRQRTGNVTKLVQTILSKSNHQADELFVKGSLRKSKPFGAMNKGCIPTPVAADFNKIAEHDYNRTRATFVTSPQKLHIRPTTIPDSLQINGSQVTKSTDTSTTTTEKVHSVQFRTAPVSKKEGLVYDSVEKSHD